MLLIRNALDGDYNIRQLKVRQVMCEIPQLCW